MLKYLTTDQTCTFKEPVHVFCIIFLVLIIPGQRKETYTNSLSRVWHMDLHMINYVHVIAALLEVLEFSNYNYITGSAKT